MNAIVTDITDLTDTDLDALLGYEPDADDITERVEEILKEARAARVAYHSHRHARRMERGGI